MCELLFCDLSLDDHRQALIMLLDSYMRDPMGGGASMADGLGDKIIAGLLEIPTFRGFFLVENGNYIGYASCFKNFSTFAAKPLINIHDFVVLPTSRGKGYGQKFINLICDYALADGCCRVNLEVREDNPVAMNTYIATGFKPCTPNMYFWERRF